MLSSNTECTAQALAIKLTAAPSGSHSRQFTLRDDGADTAVTCTISGSATTCNSGAATATIAAGSDLSFKIVTTDGGSGNPAFADAKFGWECRP